MEKVPEVLQVIRYLDHISGRQTGGSVGRLPMSGPSWTNSGEVEPRDEVQTSDPLFGGDGLLCRRKGTSELSGRRRSSRLPNSAFPSV